MDRIPIAQSVGFRGIAVKKNANFQLCRICTDSVSHLLVECDFIQGGMILNIKMMWDQQYSSQYIEQVYRLHYIMGELS